MQHGQYFEKEEYGMKTYGRGKWVMVVWLMICALLFKSLCHKTQGERQETEPYLRCPGYHGTAWRRLWDCKGDHSVEKGPWPSGKPRTTCTNTL